MFSVQLDRLEGCVLEALKEGCPGAGGLAHSSLKMGRWEDGDRAGSPPPRVGRGAQGRIHTCVLKTLGSKKQNPSVSPDPPLPPPLKFSLK